MSFKLINSLLQVKRFIHGFEEKPESVRPGRVVEWFHA